MAREIPLRVINLDRTPERLAGFCRHNAGLAFERFAACDGAAVARSEWVAAGLVTQANIYSPGALGCAASHVSLWRECVAANRPAHIVEDDVVLRADFTEVAGGLLAALGDWDVVCWTWNFNWPLRYLPGDGLAWAMLQMDPSLFAPEIAAFRAYRQLPLLTRLAGGAAMGCYTVSPKGAAALLAQCLPLGDARASLVIGDLSIGWDNTGIDVAVSCVYPQLRAFVSIPPLAVPINDQAASTIRGSGVG